MNRKKVVAFDLEGPLSPMDHAMEVLSIVPEGEKVFAVLSRYDDLLTIEGRPGYEPGDTLLLILPFLLFHHIKPEDLTDVSKRAGIVNGAKELISQLKETGWEVYIISTSYCQHALNIGRRLGIERDNIYCTDLMEIDLNKKLDRKTKSLLRETEDYIVSNLYSDRLDRGEKDNLMKPYLDRFFWEKLKTTSIGSFMDGIRVMGGMRKREALEGIAERNGVSLGDIVAIGDSITDFPMLKAVNKEGGLAIVFNGNEFSLPYGTASVASLDLRDLRLLMDKWVENGREGVKSEIQNQRSKIQIEDGPYYHWLEGLGEKELGEILDIHKRFRKAVRGEVAGALG